MALWEDGLFLGEGMFFLSRRPWQLPWHPGSSGLGSDVI